MGSHLMGSFHFQASVAKHGFTLPTLLWDGFFYLDIYLDIQKILTLSNFTA